MISSALPHSPAAAHAAEHACSRHTDLVGPRFCSECRAPLCTACTRHRPHRTCPACNVAAGRKASVPDVGWFVMLSVDGFVDALSTVKTRVLPFAVISSLLGLFGVVSLLFWQESVSGTAERTDIEAMGLLAFTAFSVVVTLGLWAQPALTLPMTRRVGFVRRMLKSLVGTALPAGVATSVMLLGAGFIALGEALDLTVVTVLGALLGGFVMFASFALSSTVLPIQAAYALRGRSMFAALRTPFAGGGGALLMMTMTWLMLLSILYSGIYAAIVPVVLLAVFAPWLAAIVGFGVSVLALCLLLVLMASYATASLRIAEDRARRE